MPRGDLWTVRGATIHRRVVKATCSAEIWGSGGGPGMRSREAKSLDLPIRAGGERQSRALTLQCRGNGGSVEIGTV